MVLEEDIAHDLGISTKLLIPPSNKNGDDNQDKIRNVSNKLCQVHGDPPCLKVNYVIAGLQVFLFSLRKTITQAFSHDL